jgi:hypothetical protein
MIGLIHTSGAAARRHHRRSPLLATLATAALLAGALGTAACDGENLFGGGRGVAHGPPVVTSITTPDRVAEGTQLDIRLKAISTQGLSLVTVRYRGALVSERTFELAARTDTVTLDFSLQIPTQVQDSILVIEAIATDQFGRVSEIRTRSVTIFSTAAPSVTASTPDGGVSPGDLVDVRVTASHLSGLQSMGYFVLSQAGDTIAYHVVPASGTQRDMTFSVRLPASIREGISVVGFAVNASNLRGESSPVVLTVTDATPPELTFLEPQEGGSYTQGSPLRVRLHVVDSASGLAEVRIRGVAFRNFPDSLANAIPVVRYPEIIIPFPQGPDRPPPVDTVLVRDLLPNADVTTEPVYVIAVARDNAGNVSMDTVRVVPGPRVTIVSPPSGGVARVNSAMQLIIQAHDPVGGLDSVKVYVTGVVNETIVRRNLGGTRELFEFEPIIQTGSQTGSLSIRAEAWNTAGSRGQTPQAVTVTVSEQVSIDTDPPQVRRRVEAPARLELQDSVRVVVQGNDGTGTGIRRMGIVAVVTAEGGFAPRSIYRSSEDFSPARSGNVERTFEFALAERFTELEMTYPRRFTLQVHAYAIDAEGNCSVAIADELSSRVCADSVFHNGRMHYLAAATPTAVSVNAVAGRSVQLPGGGRIADAVIDAPRRRAYLSNIGNNRVEIFDIPGSRFELTGSVNRRGLVGAAPWGMVISNNGDSLYVANSGGTNISVLPLGPVGGTSADYMIEDVGRRLLTPNTQLFDVVFELEDGQLRYSLPQPLDFSDRPQFIAQHATGTLVYSTLPTTAMADGTIRYIDTTVGARPEVHLMHRGAVTQDKNTAALAGIDSISISRSAGGDDLIVLYDHVPGTHQVIMSAALPLEDAVADIRSKGSDVEMFAGAWNRGIIGLSDTTFVAASTDRQVLAFGEGATAPFGRIFLCCTITPGTPLKLGLTSETAVRDLVGNAAEQVFGIGLNADGSLGVARGAQAAYFFSGPENLSLGAGPLRLQGEFRTGIAGGTGGAALHPQNTGILSADPDRRLAFVATAASSIKIIDAVHFYERGEIHVRNNVVGPVRTVLPTPEENQGLTPTDPNYIVVKLLAVTANENVTIVNVRRKDIQN